MSRLISFILAYASCEAGEKRELQNEKFLPIVGLEPTTSCLLDWHSGNRLRHGTVLNIDILGKLYTHTLLCIRKSSIKKKKYNTFQVSFHNPSRFKCHSILQTFSYNKYACTLQKINA